MDPRPVFLLAFCLLQFHLDVKAERCADKISNCRGVESYCTQSHWQDFMNRNCKKTCGKCEPPPTSGPVVPPRPGNCGIRPRTRIVGGTEAAHGGWPWQAMLRTPSGSVFCGGSLVQPQWVVTASHCVTKAGPNDLTVRLGAHRRLDEVGTEQDFRVQRIVMHPYYKRPYGLAHDIALLKLDRPAQLTKHVGLVCLPEESYTLPIDDENRKCWITGWGSLKSGGSAPKVLMQAEIPLVSDSRCFFAYPGRIHDSMICAGLDKGGVDSCQGDSGGPMVCEFGGRWYLEGATSWGVGCGDRGKFGVYAKVRYLKKWLQKAMNSI